MVLFLFLPGPGSSAIIVGQTIAWASSVIAIFPDIDASSSPSTLLCGETAEGHAVEVHCFALFPAAMSNSGTTTTTSYGQRNQARHPKGAAASPGSSSTTLACD